VQNTLAQIQKINPKYYDNTIILNNASTCLDTIEFLKNTDVTIIENANNGPWVSSTLNAHIYDALPDKYVLTDPDLQFNENLPTNFIEILSELSDKYRAGKVGFALDISDYDEMYQYAYYNGKTIYEWEHAFWENRIDDPNYELYVGSIDTTFALVNKEFTEPHFNVRVGGDFVAKHLPWYKCNGNKCNPVYNVFENYEICKKTTGISTIKGLIMTYIEENYIKVVKNNELFLIENTENNPNLSFWRDIYSNWEHETFSIFDKYLQKDKVFIDIGGWIGTTAMYGSRKSKHVYSVEADNNSFEDMQTNLQTNCLQNYTLINNAIFNADNIQIKFGKNKFLSNSKMNDSTSQIYTDGDNSDDFYFSETISLPRIIQKYQIEPDNISLIKVDIEGGEENILNDLIHIHKTHNVPLYIRFHYSWWNDKNLDRFELTQDEKNAIIANPFISLLFDA
jgi:FkbM family methyltransferase